MTESQIINLINKKLNCSSSKNEFGPFGDDGFTIPNGESNEKVVLSTDSFVEGTHFTTDMGFFSVGWKSLVSSLSDVYAMGVHPSFYSLNLVIPKGFESQDLDDFLNGLEKASKEYNVYLLGGDVTSGGSFMASYQVGGYGHSQSIKSNSGAKKGDVLMTDSLLGGALLGHKNFLSGVKDSFTNQFLFPSLNKELGPWLSQFKEVTSLRDISDGLYKEMVHISDLKDCRVHLEYLPIDKALKEQCVKLGLNAEEVALQGGEEYDLLWTLRPDFLEEFLKKYQMEFKSRPHILGRLSSHFGSQRKFVYENQDLIESIKPFEHFSS